MNFALGKKGSRGRGLALTGPSRAHQPAQVLHVQVVERDEVHLAGVSPAFPSASSTLL